MVGLESKVAEWLADHKPSFKSYHSKGPQAHHTCNDRQTIEFPFEVCIKQSSKRETGNNRFCALSVTRNLPPSVTKNPSILHASAPKMKYLNANEQQAVKEPTTDTMRFAAARFSRM